MCGSLLWLPIIQGDLKKIEKLTLTKNLNELSPCDARLLERKEPGHEQMAGITSVWLLSKEDHHLFWEVKLIQSSGAPSHSWKMYMFWSFIVKEIGNLKNYMGSLRISYNVFWLYPSLTQLFLDPAPSLHDQLCVFFVFCCFVLF